MMKHSKYFYGKVTKSGNKLLVNVPYDERKNFPYKSYVKVFLLNEDEIIEEDIVRDINSHVEEFGIVEAKKIIEKYDPQYNFNKKRSNEIIDDAKKLLEK